MRNHVLFGLLLFLFCAALGITGCADSPSEGIDNLPRVPVTDFTELLSGPEIQGTLPLSVESDHFTGEVIWQFSADGYFWMITPVNTFFRDMSYRANIYLTPKEGWTFRDVNAGNFSHQEGAVTGFESINNGGHLIISFPRFAPVGAQVISGDLTGVVSRPARDGIPQTAIAGSGFTGSVSWETEDGEPLTETVFQASTVYRAVVTIIPGTGYTLIGLGRNDFSHANARSVIFDYEGSINNNSLRTAIVHLVFSRTVGSSDPNPVTQFDLTSFIPSPEFRTEPTVSFTGNQYSGSAQWFDFLTGAPLDDEFPYGQIIGANVTLTRIDDFIFDEVPVNVFVHQNSLQVTNAPGSSVNQESLTVMIVFNELEWAPRRVSFPRLTGKPFQACCWASDNTHPDVLIAMNNPAGNAPGAYWDFAWNSPPDTNTSWPEIFGDALATPQPHNGHPVVFNDANIPGQIRRPAHVFTIDMGDDGKNMVSFGMYPRVDSEDPAHRWPTEVEVFYSNMAIPPIFAVAEMRNHIDPSADPDLHIISLGTFGENRRGIFWHDYNLVPHGTQETENNQGINARYVHFRIYDIETTANLGASFSQIRIGVQE